MGAQLVKEVATKTDDIAGDGTTTATVLAQAMISAGMKNVAAGANPMSIKKGIEAAVAAAVTSIGEQSKDVDDKSDIASVATISAADASIGQVIADAIDKVGKDGVVTVEESNTFGTELDFTEGMQFDKGYLSPYFVTDAERQEVVLDDCYVLLNSAKISTVQDMLPTLEAVMQTGKPLLIIAEDIDGEALATLVVNKIRGTFNAAPSRPRLRRPPQGDAAGHGSPHRRPGHQRRGRPQARERHPRPARHRQARRDHQGQHDHRRWWRRADDIDGRVNQIKAEIENTDSDWDREKLQERLAKLAGGVAVIKVGAATEVELKEKKHRIEDAVSSVRAAIEEGVVAGGGTALIRARSAVQTVVESLEGDEQTGAKTVWSALVAPGRNIANNAGLEGSVVVREVEDAEGSNGMNAATGEMMRPHRCRHHRSGQGDPCGSAERGVHRRDAADHRGARR